MTITYWRADSRGLEMRKPVDGTAALAMLVLCLVWGAQQVAIKAIADDMDTIMQVAMRSGIAAVLVWGMGRLVLREAWLPSVWCRSGVAVGLLFAGEFLFIAEGLRWTSASHMAVFLYTAPLFAAIGLHLRIRDEQMTGRQWIGMALAFIGIAVTFLAPRPGVDIAAMKPSLWGDAMGLCAGATWGMTTVVVRCSRLSEAPATQTLYYQLAGAFLILFPMALLRSDNSPAMNAAVLGSLAFQTLIVSVASYLVWFWMLRHYLAARLGILALLTPLFGVLLGALLLNESTSDGFIAGAALSLLGLLLVNVKGKRAECQRRTVA
ncbi:DMT family transporter [Pseudomonas putida]|uniref:DMT family transporter n=1 Tax=Pseudomonas putida TaxID=303 RepID=UPI003204F23E